jgi:transposase-like protein
MDIRKAAAKFGSDEDCLKYIQEMRWPDGVIRCPECGCKNVKRIERSVTKKGKNKRGWFFLCGEKSCREQFSPTSGTLFHDTHLPLIVWFHAIALILNAKKGISAAQLQRDLGIGGYKTAWYLNHRIREAMREGAFPQLGGIVEIDETYIGGRRKGHENNRRDKEIVVGLRERKGPLRFIHAKDTTSRTWSQIVAQNLRSDVDLIMTDDSCAAHKALRDSAKHRTINHSSGQYVVGEVHTNTVESAFSLLKRGILGQFHRISKKHLQKYLNEFSYRFNRRKDTGVFQETVGRMCNFPPLQFAVLTK